MEFETKKIAVALLFFLAAAFVGYAEGEHNEWKKQYAPSLAAGITIWLMTYGLICILVGFVARSAYLWESSTPAMSIKITRDHFLVRLICVGIVLLSYAVGNVYGARRTKKALENAASEAAAAHSSG